uniref:Ovule protein n=1 Tax=Panagrellus redivivus TaxID=6233 RepID=A0A7E4UTM3_PANRE
MWSSSRLTNCGIHSSQCRRSPSCRLGGLVTSNKVSFAKSFDPMIVVPSRLNISKALLFLINISISIPKPNSLVISSHTQLPDTLPNVHLSLKSGCSYLPPVREHPTHIPADSDQLVIPDPIQALGS